MMLAPRLSFSFLCHHHSHPHPCLTQHYLFFWFVWIAVDIETLEGNNNNEETNDVGKMMEATGQEYNGSPVVFSQPGLLAGL